MTDQIRAALVTGGARRIGRAIVCALHQAGYAVATFYCGDIQPDRPLQ